MPAAEVPISADLIEELEGSFNLGPMIDDQGRRGLDEEEVDRFEGMVVVIQGDEHPPPHFHVRSNGQSASFAITDGARMPGIKGLERFDRNIKKWWKKNYCVLILTWNSTRPTDCGVGPVEIPEECKPKPRGA